MSPTIRMTVDRPARKAHVPNVRLLLLISVGAQMLKTSLDGQTTSISRSQVEREGKVNRLYCNPRNPLPSSLDPYYPLMDSTANLHYTLGALEIGILISLFLFGIVTVQCSVYYDRFPNDSWHIKFLVRQLRE